MRVPLPPRPPAPGHTDGRGQLVGVEVNRDRGDLVQLLGIEPFTTPAGQDLEDDKSPLLPGPVCRRIASPEAAERVDVSGGGRPPSGGARRGRRARTRRAWTPAAGLAHVRLRRAEAVG